ncbi:Secreted repeat of uncharacterised function [uncultured archaeon]|nr:Secreted repeat of uncharacterised function [uncultured archaeon]
MFYTEKIVVPSTMNASDFGVITNSAGAKQTTYRNLPLYYYINDTKRGDTNGQGFINAWSVVSPDAASLAISSTTTSSSAPTITVTSFPSSANGDSKIVIQWNVAGGTPGVITNTAIYWGYKTGSTNTSDYPKVSSSQTGKSPQGFSTEITVPSGGYFYFRANAVVDGVNILSPEYQISIIAPTGGGGGGY